MRPFGAYRLTTRTPPHAAATMRASASGSASPSVSLAAVTGRPKLVTTSAMPTRLAMATPFQRPCPWCASS